MEITESMRLRFIAKIDVNGETGCWVWTACRNPRGYGQFVVRKPYKMQAHRFAYEAFVGPIPDGLQLDHLCRVTSCVNPEHLEPVTNAENKRRVRSDHCSQGHPKDLGRRCKECDRLKEQRRSLTRYQRHLGPKGDCCHRGHPLSGENLYPYKGRRLCKECNRMRARQAAERRRSSR